MMHPHEWVLAEYERDVTAGMTPRRRFKWWWRRRELRFAWFMRDIERMWEIWR
jgi:hypothetical protein